MPDHITGLFEYVVRKLQDHLRESKHKVLSKYTVEDYLNNASVRGTVEAFCETVDNHLTELYEAALKLLRISLLRR